MGASNNNRGPGERGRPDGGGPAGRAPHWLGLDPDQRIYPSRRWAVIMLAVGLLMLVTNTFSAAVAPPGGTLFARLTAAAGGVLVLLALSDLLAGGGGNPSGARLRRTVVILRVIAILCLAGVSAGWVWAVVTGSILAAVALAFGAACGALALLVAWARR